MEVPESGLEREVLTELLEVYKYYEVLWDPFQALYYNKEARKQAFQCLLKIFQRLKPGATLKDVKKKIENMRGTYKKELKKVKESLVIGKEEYIPTLWYFDLMLFLDEKNVVQQSSDTMKQKEEHSSFVEENAEEDFVEPATSQTPIQTNSFHSSPTPVSHINHPKKKHIDTACCLLHGESDQFDVFGLSVAHQLRTLNSTQQAIAQKLISDAIFLGKLEKLTPTAAVLPAEQKLS